MNIHQFLTGYRTAVLLACFGGAAVLPAQAAIRINDVTVTEGQTAVLTVSLDQPVRRGGVRVNYTTRNGSASAGQDYVATSGRLTFRRGDQSQQITVRTVNDSTAEPTETFSVVLDNARGDNIADNTGVVTILDNDTQANSPPVCTVNTPATNVTITAGESVNYTATVTDPDGDPLTISWNFPGGTPASSGAEDPGNVVYGSAGTFTATLNADDGRGGSCAQQSRTITVNPVQQNACTIGVSPTSLAFGDVNVGQSGSLGTTVSNSGNAACNVNITRTGSADFAATPLSFTVQPGNSRTVSVTYTPAAVGADTGNLAVASNDPVTPGVNVSLSGNGVQQQVQCIPANPNGISINSTAQSGCPDGTVPQASQVLNSNTRVLAINDLGMHCGDLDTRIASILPPFQVLLAQVIQQGAQPVLNPAGVNVFYSAASNPNDPVLGLVNRDGLKADGSTYKTNFWNFPVPAGTYDPFYPAFNPFNPAQTLTPLAGPPFNVTADVGLPVPNVEDLFIGPDGQVNSGDEFLSAVQHAMPGIAAPYTANNPQRAKEHYADKPFFVNFPFGYVAAGVDWYEGAGIPFAAFDDNGRENAYPLVRVEARNAGGTTLATVDTVLPISGEASCVNCHADPTDLTSITGRTTNSSDPTDALASNVPALPVALSTDDPDNNLPARVSLEYAADINILRLHDLKHGASYVTPSAANDGSAVAAACNITANGGNGDGNCLTNRALVQGEPVVCQVCHYTPALDLAQLGPLTGPAGTVANGRVHLQHRSNSNVMHSHHGSLGVFPNIDPPQQQANGTITNQANRLAQLEDSCYQCHPGTNVQCLRGAMFNGGMLCSDCHGSMLQVGDDFSRNVSPGNPGAFELTGNFYTDPGQPRVPWANEPGCGSCHTGDVNNNMAGDPGTVTNTTDTNGNTDGVRLRQAYLTGDAKATPIVPANKRFAEPAVPASFNGFANPGAGNPQLYRVSTGHGGVMCEGCHGATHAEWPNANPNSNDNITANQLQGHTGTIIECSTCHGTTMNSQTTLEGPHGMHPVGNDTSVSSGSAAGPRVSFVDGGHEHIASTANCSGCHGPGGRGTNQGSVLSVAKKDRRLNGRLIPAGTPIGCSICH